MDLGALPVKRFTLCLILHFQNYKCVFVIIMSKSKALILQCALFFKVSHDKKIGDNNFDFVLDLDAKEFQVRVACGGRKCGGRKTERNFGEHRYTRKIMMGVVRLNSYIYVAALLN